MKFIVLIILLINPMLSAAANCIGHIFFYSISDGRGEAEIDFSVYYHKSKSWLPAKGVSFSLHTELPVKSKTCFSTQVEIPKDKLKYSHGYVFVKPNNEIKVIGGVMTGVDMGYVINDIFKK